MAEHVLDGQVALVTGGSRGIGRAIAGTLLDAGACVTITGRDEDALEATVQELGGDGRLLAVRADVAAEADVRGAVATTSARFGSVTALVCNAAAAGPTEPVHEMAAADFAAVIDTNLVGPFLCAKHVLPAMIDRRGGSIVMIGSVAGVEAYPLRAPYAASKWGLRGLTRTLAAEAGPHGVRVNLVAPGPTEGERAARVIRARAEAEGVPLEEVRARYQSQVPLRRFVTGQEVAAAVRFLLSEAASGITGQDFCVSGGIEI
jgi:NAD(P)-dependent dehydrogenase (short-subunit alcohol dehydrogenase family)